MPIETKGTEKSRAPVAVVVISDLEFGGAQRQVVELANNMPDERYKLHVVSLHDYIPLAEKLKRSEGRVHIVQRRSKFDASVVGRLATLLRELKADVVHGYLFDAEIATRLAGRKTKIAVVGSERNTDYTLKPINKLAYRLTRNLRHLTIANSNAGAAFNQQLLKNDASTYRVVHNGVDAERFQPGDGSAVREELGILPDERLIGMFASFKPQKNHPLLLKAAKRVISKVPNLRILFVGDELFMGMSGSVEFKKEVQALADALGIRDRCLFAGNRQDVERCYRACDITVLPSLFEGTPNVALESMASGVPVVATNVSDNSFVIPEGKGGYVVPLHDEQAMADRICQLLTDDTHRSQVGASAREWIMEEFTGPRLAEKTAKVYDEAIQINQSR